MTDETGIVLQFDRELRERGERTVATLAEARGRLLPVTDHVERVADARCAIYAGSLLGLVDGFAGEQFTSDGLEELLTDLRSLADRMQGFSTAAAGSSVLDGRRPPQGER